MSSQVDEDDIAEEWEEEEKEEANERTKTFGEQGEYVKDPRSSYSG